MAYYSSTFNTLHKPKESEEFYNIKSKDFYEFLDSLFLVLDTNIQKFNYSLMTPKNILVSFSKADFRVFLGDEKAIAELNTIAYQTHEQPQLPSLEDANNMGIQQLGFKFDCYFDVSISQFNKSLTFIKENFDKSKVEKLKIFSSLLDLMQSVLKNGSINISTSRLSFFNCFMVARHQLMNEFERKRAIMNFNPRFQARNIVVKPNQGFYVLPFEKGPENAMQAIKDEINSNKLDCELIKSADRFDPTRGNNIVENIWQDICASSFIIADISNRNPNVFYELGICDTIGKNVITLCSRHSLENDYDNRLPFDIATQYTIIYDEDYNGYKKMTEEVVKRIKAILRIDNGVNN